MYCERCGTQLDDNMSFCLHCGNPVDRTFCEKNIKRTMTYTRAVELAKEGKEEGYQFLYESTYKKKMYIALKYMKNEDAAMDILQDAYMKAFSKLDTLKDPEKFPGWVGMIIANTAKSALEKKNPLLFSQMEQDNDEGEAIAYEIEDEDTWNQPELAYTQQETQELVWELIDSLSEEQKLCVMMFHIEGISIKDIAETMGCSENTVKSRLNYGRKNIKEKAEELQKKGVKLYSSAPIALLVYLLQKESGAFTLSEIAQTTATYAHFVAHSGTALVGVGQTSGVAQAVSQASGVMETVVGSAGNATSVAGKMASTIGREAGKTFLKTTVGKITIGLAATAILGIGIFFGTQIPVAQENVTTEHTTEMMADAVTEEMTEAVTEEATTEEQLTEEEMYYAFLEEEWIPEHGIGITSASATAEIRATERYEVIVDDWLHTEGALAADIYDYDGDGIKDMLLVHDVEGHSEYGDYIVTSTVFDIYTIENNQVLLKDTNTCCDPEGIYDYRYKSVNCVDDPTLILNRVEVEGITYLVYTYFSKGGLGATGYMEQHYVMQYIDGNWQLIGFSIAEGYGGGHYARFENGQTVEDDYFEPGEDQRLKSCFAKMGIDIITMFDDDTPELYNVRNADAFSILAVDVDATFDEGYRSGSMTYTVTDGTGLRDRVSQE